MTDIDAAEIRRGPGRPPKSPMQRSDQRSPQRITLRTAENRFDLDQSRIPPGMHYEWKVQTVNGQEQVEAKINQEANGWTPVPANRHPELAGKRATAEQSIIRGGLMLMERPLELTEEARMMDDLRAGDQVSTQLARLQLGAKRAGAGSKTRVQRSVSEIPPDDE